MWVCLLEKAYAKLQGSYGRITADHPSNALTHLTGVSNREYRHFGKDKKKVDEVW